MLFGCRLALWQRGELSWVTVMASGEGHVCNDATILTRSIHAVHAVIHKLQRVH